MGWAHPLISSTCGLLLWAILGGCDAGGETQAPPDAARPDAGAARPGDRYVAGLTKRGSEGLSVALLEATPAPPERVPDNTWRVQVLAGEAPVEGCEIAVRPFMPQHGHGTTPTPTVTPAEGSGTYQIEPLNLFMPGLWEIALSLSCGATEDEVLFRFWIEG